MIHAATEGMFPLMEAALRPYLEICPFYDQFGTPPLEGPFDGGGVPILVVGNHSDPGYSVRRIRGARDRNAQQRLSGGDPSPHAHRLPSKPMR